MAKVTGPLFSIDARGKLADSIVFLGWRGLKTVRQWVKPANPNTAAQQAVRGYFTTSVNKYHLLDGGDQGAWKERASGKPYSGFNLFMDLASSTLNAAKTWVLIKAVAATGITASGANIVAKADASGAGKLKYGTEPGVYYNEVSLNFLANTLVTATLSGLSSAVKYYYRLVFPEAANTRGETGDYTFTTT